MTWVKSYIRKVKNKLVKVSAHKRSGGKKISKLPANKRVALKTGEFKPKSSFISKAKYNQKDRSLDVRIGGQKYRYLGVTKKVYEDFVSSKSSSSYFSKNIRGQFKTLKL